MTTPIFSFGWHCQTPSLLADDIAHFNVFNITSGLPPIIEGDEWGHLIAGAQSLREVNEGLAQTLSRLISEALVASARGDRRQLREAKIEITDIVRDLTSAELRKFGSAFSLRRSFRSNPSLFTDNPLPAVWVALRKVRSGSSIPPPDTRAIQEWPYRSGKILVPESPNWQRSGPGNSFAITVDGKSYTIEEKLTGMTMRTMAQQTELLDRVAEVRRRPTDPEEG